MPWQTAEDYAASTSAGDPVLHGQLTWFTRALWRAAYDPRDLPEDLMIEARVRMAQLKTALKGSAKGITA